ncbi:complement C1q tumor necrosis factor-related protein 3-like [Saccostrea cucullata]|uniref:complement C1q tumor necrosis factor-related protein 3-like n=1 Tax=Saccostrea cuccullata TaxID=36930 RepID=UPI002ED24EBA
MAADRQRWRSSVQALCAPSTKRTKLLIKEVLVDYNLQNGCSSLHEDVAILTKENLVLRKSQSKFESEIDVLKSQIKDILSENRKLKENLNRIDKEISRTRNKTSKTEDNVFFGNNTDKHGLSKHHQRQGLGPQNRKRLLGSSPGIPVSSPIAFTAWLSANVNNPSDGQTFVFDHIVTNFGNAYNHHNGMFTATVKGIYAFYVSILTGAGKSMEVEVVRNNLNICYVYSGDMDFWGPGFNMAVADLNVGDAVWVKVSTWHDSGLLVDSRFTSFSGFLLYETD